MDRKDNQEKDELNYTYYPKMTLEGIEKEAKKKGSGFETLKQPKEKKKQEWWVPDMLPKERLILLAAQGGTGKTSLAFYLADMLTRQGWVIDDGTPVRAAYWSFEDEPQDFVNKMGPNENVLFLRWNKLHPFGGKEEDIEELKEYLFARNAQLLFIDPVSALLTEDGNNNQAVRQVLNKLLAIASEMGATIVGVHHCRKGGAKTIRELIMGASAWVDTARHVLTMVKSEDERVFLEVAKSNVGGKGVSWEIYSEIDEYGYHTTGFNRAENGSAQKALDGEKPVIPIIKALKEKFEIGKAFNLDDIKECGKEIRMKAPLGSFYQWKKANPTKWQECKTKKDGKKAWIFI